MEWEKVLRDSVRDGSIKSVYLEKVPLLKNCTDWTQIEVMGEIDYLAKNSHYHGVLVKLAGKIYFVQKKTFDAVQEFLRIRKLPKIEVKN